MERPEIDWDDTDAFTVGTVGPAGRRVFFIQARRAGQVVSLKLEKQQVAGLAEFLDGIEEIGIRAIAQSAGGKASIERELFEVERAVASDAELELAIGSTLGDTTQKAALVDRLLGSSISAATAAIVRPLVQSPRGRRIGELLRSAADLVADANGRIVATVTSAAPLSAAHEKKLVQTLTARYERTPILNVVIDDRILGGLRVQVGDEVVDGTIASRLADLRLQLAG